MLIHIEDTQSALQLELAEHDKQELAEQIGRAHV